ncbi:hypothetical protein LFM09_02970 [Lentzea alba]|uniref:hypothetical protein n=1 Tax=Lentzea alba TaxID=2714351 RepID=UPI0039BF2E3C
MTTRRLFGAVLVFVAAGLGIAATFLSAYSVSVEFGGRTLRFESTTWDIGRNDFGNVLLLAPIEYGEAAIGGALVMIVSAALAFWQPAARVGSLLGAGVLMGAAWSAVSALQGLVERLSDVDVPVPLSVEQGDGMTLLIVAAGVAAVSAVLHQELPRRQVPEPHGDAVIHQIEPDDSETPPYGFPVIVEPKSD